MQSAALEPAANSASQNGSRLIKNTSVLMVSQLLTWGFTLLLTLFMPRYLGPEANGVLAIAASVWSILQVFICFGTDTYLVKQIARQPEKIYTFLGTSFVLKFLFYLIGVVPLSLALWLLKTPMETVIVIQVMGLSSLVGALGNGTQATLQGLEIMEYISISSVVSKAVHSILGIGLLLMGYGLFAMVAVMTASALVLLLLQLYFLHRYKPLRIGFELAQVWPLLRNSFPYMATALVMMGYTQVNVIVLSAMMSPTEVGWYGAAVQLFATFLFLPVVFSTALLPQMTRTFTDEADKLPHMLRKSVELVLLIGVPLGFGLVAVGSSLVALLFGDAYGPTGPVLQVMGVALIFMYLNVLIGQFFTSIDRQNTWTITITCSVAVMAGLAILLVPTSQRLFGSGAVGGALSLLISEAGMVVIGVLLLRNNLISKTLLWSSARIFLAASVMLAIVWPLRDAVLVLPVGVGMAVYLGMVLLLNIVPHEDRLALRSFAASILTRVSSRA